MEGVIDQLNKALKVLKENGVNEEEKGIEYIAKDNKYLWVRVRNCKYINKLQNKLLCVLYYNNYLVACFINNS